MSVSADKASAFAAAFATGINSMAFIANADALAARLRAGSAARWRKDVLSAIVGLERACEVLKQGTPSADLDEAYFLVVDLIRLLKLRRWDPIKISAASARCMEKFGNVLKLTSG